MKRHICPALLACALFCEAALPFNWPAKNLDGERLRPSFAQNRAGKFNVSLVFPNAESAVAADGGKIIAVILEGQNGGNGFESTLGNAVIVMHNDDLLSVYGNLSSQAAEALLQKKSLSAEEELGSLESSAWSEGGGAGALEFQITDAKAKSFINPLILMPRSIKPRRILLDGISIQNQFGRVYNLQGLRSVPAGMYSVYKRRQENVSPHKAEVYVNGAENEKVSKETLLWQEGRIGLRGTGFYTSADFYPSDGLELLGHILLPHGINTITVRASDIFENAVTATFNVTGY